MTIRIVTFLFIGHTKTSCNAFINIWFKVNTTNNHKNNTSVSALVGEEKKNLKWAAGKLCFYPFNESLKP